MRGRLVLVLSRDLFIGLLEYPHDMTADFFIKSDVKERAERKPQCLLLT